LTYVEGFQKERELIREKIEALLYSREEGTVKRNTDRAITSVSIMP
jgi:hypothetical protein